MISEELKTIIDTLNDQGKMAFLEGATEEQIAQFEKPRAVPYKDCGSVYDEGWLDDICTENRDDEE